MSCRAARSGWKAQSQPKVARSHSACHAAKIQLSDAACLLGDCGRAMMKLVSRFQIYGRHHHSVSKRLPLHSALVIGAIGVVYGDIGTSPLYAVNETFFGVGHTPVTHDNVLGVIGLIFWLLTVVVSCKYMFFVLRASYQGEGGMFALHELVAKAGREYSYGPVWLLIHGARTCLLLPDN